MNKKTLSKITAILCLTTLFTSSLGQIASAQEEVNRNEKQHHVIGSIIRHQPLKLHSNMLKSRLENAKEKGELKKLLLTPDEHTDETLLMTELSNSDFGGDIFVPRAHKCVKEIFDINSCVKLILEYAKEADILDLVLTTKDKNGKTALNYANTKASFETILEYAQTVNKTEELLTATDNDGKTILMHAATYCFGIRAINLILSYAEKNNILDTVINATTTSEFNNCSFEHSALTFAVENNQLNNAKKLIEKGCKGIKCLASFDTDICSSTHKPIIKSLIQYKNFDMVKLLVENDKFDDLKQKVLNMDTNELLKLVKENKKTEVFDMLQKWSVSVTFFTGYKPMPTFQEIISTFYNKVIKVFRK